MPSSDTRAALEDRLRAAAQAAGVGSTHWQGCEAEHKWCAVLVVLDELDRLRAEVARYREALERLTVTVEYTFRRSDYDDVHRRYRRMQKMEEGEAKWSLRDSLPDEVRVSYGAMRDLRALTTEGGDRAEE